MQRLFFTARLRAISVKGVRSFAIARPLTAETSFCGVASSIGSGTIVVAAALGLGSIWTQCEEPPRDFYIFGSPVTMSPSPVIHTVGFAENGFPHRYGHFDDKDAMAAVARLRESQCGGGSVTIPHKETLLNEMDEVSEAARIIGAVNTVTKGPDGRLYGDNTDWLGIKRQLEARLPQPLPVNLTCLLCGAGGTGRAAAYALREMGASRVMIYNRTHSRAQALAIEFGFEAVVDLDSTLYQLDVLHIVVDTMPGSSHFTLPAGAQLASHKPVVFEAAYIPRRTALVTQALEAGCEVVEGIEMLFEQGCAQCEIWTGRPAPRKQIAAALVQELFTEGSSHPAHAVMQPYDKLPAALLRETA